MATTNAQEVINSPTVDVVFVLTSDEFHEEYAIAALDAGKHVMVEKPLSLSTASVKRIIEAETRANGPIVFVGYMRRYAPSFVQTFKREIATIPQIMYARSRDFPGPNPIFVEQSGTFPVKNSDVPEEVLQQRAPRLQRLYQECFPGQVLTKEKADFCQFMGTLGSHDISLMRETLGVPSGVAGVTVHPPFHNALFNYYDKEGRPFAVTYESGFDGVPDFDAHLAVYGFNKRVMIKYDTPFVKGLAIKVVVQETNEAGEIVTREAIGSYEDAYTVELKELHECLVNGKAVKTTAKDALQDLQIYDMMYAKWVEGLPKEATAS